MALPLRKYTPLTRSPRTALYAVVPPSSNDVVEPVPAGTELVDTDATITRDQAKALFQARKRGVLRAISHTAEFVQDNFTIAELDDLEAEGLALVGLYAVFRRSGWGEDDAGTLDGARDLANFQDLGKRVASARLILDLEGGSDVTKAQWMRHAKDWLVATRAPGVKRMIYDGIGFFAMLTKAEKDWLVADDPDVLWWDAGTAAPGIDRATLTPTKGYVLRQSPQTRIAGAAFDPDTVAANDNGELTWIRAATAPADAAPSTLPPAPSGMRWVRAGDATEDEIRDFVVSTYLPLAGLSAAPDTREKYLDIIAPMELEGVDLRNAMANMWSCALTVDGEDRKLLSTAPPEAQAKARWLWARYVNANAMTDEENTAYAFGALRMAKMLDVKSGVCPKRGDHVIIDASGTAHTYSLTSDPDADGVTKTVEGGAVDAQNYKAIEAGERKLLENGAITDRAGKAAHTLYCWIDIVTLLRNAGAWVLTKAPAPVEGPPATTSGPSSSTTVATHGGALAIGAASVSVFFSHLSLGARLAIGIPLGLLFIALFAWLAVSRLRK